MEMSRIMETRGERWRIVSKVVSDNSALTITEDGVNSSTYVKLQNQSRLDSSSERELSTLIVVRDPHWPTLTCT